MMVFLLDTNFCELCTNFCNTKKEGILTIEKYAVSWFGQHEYTYFNSNKGACSALLYFCKNAYLNLYNFSNFSNFA